MTQKEVHAVLQSAYDQIKTLYNQCDDIGTDTSFAIGELLGCISKAKALVGRDIDQAAKTGTTEPH